MRSRVEVSRVDRSFWSLEPMFEKNLQQLELSHINSLFHGHSKPGKKYLLIYSESDVNSKNIHNNFLN